MHAHLHTVRVMYMYIVPFSSFPPSSLPLFFLSRHTHRQTDSLPLSLPPSLPTSMYLPPSFPPFLSPPLRPYVYLGLQFSEDISSCSHNTRLTTSHYDSQATIFGLRGHREENLGLCYYFVCYSVCVSVCVCV